MNAEYMPCAEVAKLVRDVLKKGYPGIKFSVKSKVYSGGASISINWIDGPTTKQVDEKVKCFAGSHSEENGGDSIKMGHNSKHPVTGKLVRYGSDYIFTRREFSVAFMRRMAEHVAREWGQPVPDIWENKYGHAEYTQTYERLTGRYSLTDLIFQACHETNASTKHHKVKPAATADGKLVIQREADRVIISGDTYPRREYLRGAGASWHKAEQHWALPVTLPVYTALSAGDLKRLIHHFERMA